MSVTGWKGLYALQLKMNSMIVICPKIKKYLLISMLHGILSTSAQAGSDIVWSGLQDPNLKDALFDSYQGNHFAAITRLQSAQKQRRIKQPERAALVLGGIYLSYGFHGEAERLFKTFLDQNQPADIKDQAWFYLGKTQYQRGHLEDAKFSISQIGDSIGVGLKAEKQALEGIILLKLKRYNEAVAIFDQVSNLSDWSGYAKYNMAIAQYKNGQRDDSIKLLAELGADYSSNKEFQNLSDKANLTLGYGFLNEGNYAQSEKFLNRMLLTGRSANQALFVLGRVHSSQQDYRQSLISWLELSKRDPSDAAVQQAMMGVPYALGKMEAYKQSLQYYEKAMRSFQKEIEKINLAAESISSGTFLEGLIRAENGSLEGGGAFTVERVLDTPEGHYLWPLVTTFEFREALYNYSQLRMSLGKLELWSASLTTYESLTKLRRDEYKKRIVKLQTEVLLASSKLEYHMQTLAYDELNSRKKVLVKYFDQARFSVAKIYDYAAKRWGSE